MEKNMSRILIETVVKTTLKNLKEDPERSIRNLVDMALHFSDGRFQHSFFQTAQTMLENENSPYYALVRNLISYADTEHLFTFGMDLGYNSCTYGAQQIRQNEKRLRHNIPWTILLQTGDLSPVQLGSYSTAISEGEGLGIYTWMLFPTADHEKVLDLIRDHPDSAFFLFCAPEDLSASLLDGFSELKNIMPVLRYREEQTEGYARLRALGVPYCAWLPYGEDDLAAIQDGEVFLGVQQAKAAFTALVPRQGCPEEVRLQVQQAVERARNEQHYQTIPWELEQDNQRVDEIISDDACTVCFDQGGHLLDSDGSPTCPDLCLFDRGLTEVLRLACPKGTAEVSGQ